MVAEVAHVEYLKKVPIFKSLPARDLEAVARSLKERVYEPAAVIVKQGDPGVGFFLIVEGRGEGSHDGHHIPDMGPGGFFGGLGRVAAAVRAPPGTGTG